MKETSKNLPLEEYIEILRKAVGRKDRIKKALSNDEMLKKYLTKIGVKPSWLENAACMEIIKSRIATALRESRRVRVRDDGIMYDQGSMIRAVRESTVELGSPKEILRESEDEEGFIIYEAFKSIKNYETRKINEYGVVVYEQYRFGGSGEDPHISDFQQQIEYFRNPNKPQIIYRSEYRNDALKEPVVNERKEYDYAYPIVMDKNGMSREKTPIYFIKQYPRYGEWFDQRYRNKDEYVSRAFDMQAQSIEYKYNEDRDRLISSMEDVSTLRRKLNNIYAAIVESIKTSKGGAVFKFLLMRSVERVLEEDPNELFQNDEQKGVVYEAIVQRLSEDPIPDEELMLRISQDKKKVRDRLRENEDLKEILQTFKTKKSIDDDDYSLSEAFKDVQERSAMVISFDRDENPFDEEIDRLKAKYSFLHKQRMVLQQAVRLIPHYRRKVKNKTLQRELEIEEKTERIKGKEGPKEER